MNTSSNDNSNSLNKLNYPQCLSFWSAPVVAISERLPQLENHIPHVLLSSVASLYSLGLFLINCARVCKHSRICHEQALRLFFWFILVGLFLRLPLQLLQPCKLIKVCPSTTRTTHKLHKTMHATTAALYHQASIFAPQSSNS